MPPYRSTKRARKPRPPLCLKCGFVHSEMTSTSRIGRFSLAVPRYRARYDGAPHRSTRAEAHQDMCDHLRSLTK